MKSVMAHMVLQMIGTCGSGQRDELIVGVDRLRLLVGPDSDGREGGDEQARIEHALDDGQHVGVHRDLLEGGAVDEEVVDPRRLDALEEVVRRHDAKVVFELEEVLVDFVDESRARWRRGGWCSRLRRCAGGAPGDPGEDWWPSLRLARCPRSGIVRKAPVSAAVLRGRRGARAKCPGGRVVWYGPLAQLVAHLHDAQGVRGSSPLRPTRQLRASTAPPPRPRPGRLPVAACALGTSRGNRDRKLEKEAE